MLEMRHEMRKLLARPTMMSRCAALLGQASLDAPKQFTHGQTETSAQSEENRQGRLPIPILQVADMSRRYACPLGEGLLCQGSVHPGFHQHPRERVDQF